MTPDVADGQQAVTAKLLRGYGLEALRFGAGLLAPGTDERMLRVALREISSGIELFLKGLLAGEHWALVFDNPSKASLQAFKSGTFKSVGFDECIQRLKEIVGVGLDQKQAQLLGRMREKRNRLEHLGTLDNVFALRASIGGALHAIAELSKEAEKAGLLDAKDKALHTDLAIEFSTVADFVDARWNELQQGIQRDDGDPCPSCGQLAGVVRDGLDCLFCGSHSSAWEAAREYIRVAVDPPPGTKCMHECPQCGQEAMVDTQWAHERYRCFSCDVRYRLPELTKCPHCERLFTGDHGSNMCEDCFTELVARYD